MIHYSPDSAWMNDPNGMVFYEGEYHLFFQYYPDSTVWGPMHWGHAVSKDMVYWEHLPIALYPDELGYIFSGSAVIDWNNTTGLQEGDHPPMIAIFTHHEPEGAADENNILYQYQSIAYSNDKGRTWTKYEGNPVIPNPGIEDFRDPKVIWNEETELWTMILAAADRIKIYTSPNLIEWTDQSEFGASNGAHGGVWECPDLFPLKVEGSDETKWILLLSINPGGPNGGSATQYFVGDFDGKTFTTNQEETLWLDHGRDNYAGVTWSDVPKEDGRRLFIGWMSNWNYGQQVPSKTWRSAMTLPRSLHLVKNDLYEVESRPVDEIASLEMDSEIIIVNSEVVSEDVQPLGNATKTELTFDLNATTANKFGFELVNIEGEVYQFGYDKDRSILFSNRIYAGEHSFSDDFGKVLHIAPYTTDKGLMTFEVYLDRASVEVFVNNGERVVTELVFPSAPFTSASVFFTEGDAEVVALKNTPLKSIWSNQ